MRKNWPTNINRVKKPVYFHQRFHDFERFAAGVIGWDIDFCQLDRGNFETDITQVEFNGVLLSNGSFNRRLEQRGGAPPRALTFAILEPSSPEIIWRGQKVSDQMMMVYPPGSEIDAASPPGFRVLTLSISIDVFKGWDDLYRLDGGRKIRSLCMVTKVNPVRLAVIRHAARTAVETVRSGLPLRQDLVTDLPNLVVSALPAARAIRSNPSIKKRNRLLKSLTAYIDDHIKDPISLAELSAEANVSPRTIQYSFLDRLGVTPKEYIRARRLNGVHRDLSKADPRQMKVSDVANEWGFWHLGQFAADYKRLFGELPSQTLAR